MKSCPCGYNRIIFLRKDLSELECAAEEFEQEDGILREVQQKFLLDDDFLQSNLFACTEDDGYRPYCKIDSAFPERLKQNSYDLDYISQRVSPRSIAQESLSTAGSSSSSLEANERLLQNVGFCCGCYYFDWKRDLVYLF